MNNFNRRRFLKGLGACVALPAFESLLPVSLRAAESIASTAAPASAAAAPVRMAFVYFPNGAIPQYWWPKGEGKDFELAQTMKPQGRQAAIQVLGGLDHVNATWPRRSWRSCSPRHLPHRRAIRKTAGRIHAGISIDQIVANQIGHLTRFPSLGCLAKPPAKPVTAFGYSCAYQYNPPGGSPIALVPRPIRGWCSNGCSAQRTRHAASINAARKKSGRSSTS